MVDEEGDFYSDISNPKVTTNEEVSKTNIVNFDDYKFEEVEMQEIMKEKEGETSEIEIGVKKGDGFLISKIKSSNTEGTAPNVRSERKFLQKTNTKESKPSLEQIELKCNYCLKQFSKRSVLMCHVKEVHEKTGDFACGFCEKRFYRKSSLIVHERKHTGE